MLPKSFSLFFFLLLFIHASAQRKITDQLEPAISMSIEGHIGKKLDASYTNRILAQDVDKLISPFRNRTETRCWQSEFWGKWFTSAVLAYKYRPEPALKKILDNAVTGLIATQTADGYIGNYAPDKILDQWDIWGRKYCMLGLLDYYDLTGDKKVLQSARRLADNLIRDLSSKDGIIVTKGNHRGMAASSVLEPVCYLYERTGDKKYLSFAEDIVRQWETPEGPQLISKASVNVSERFPKPKNWFGWEQGQKAYEMMSCYEGLLELYRITGKEEYKKAVELTWQNIRDREINLAGSGSAVECWFGGKDRQMNAIYHYQETCVTATWLKLSHQLLKLTGEARYADAAEQTFYNALLGSMSADGAHWAKYTPLSGQRLPGSEQCGMGLNCCEASGPRGLFNFPQHIVMKEKPGIRINYFVGGTYRIRSPKGQDMKIIQHTDYPASGRIVLETELAAQEEMTIDIRIPAWSRSSVIKVNGVKTDSMPAGSYASLRRNWKKGDTIVVELDMRGRIERSATEPQYIAIMRGPLLLSRDTRLGGPDISAMLTPVEEKGSIRLEPVSSRNNDIWLEYTARFMPESYTETAPQPLVITFCDYSSAGNGAEPSMFKVWLPQLLDPRKLK
jgi:DUF1680 family protein